jgi:hypothetical protein
MRLDQKIEELVQMVARRLDLCPVMSNGLRCTLPANHLPPEEHEFRIEFHPSNQLLKRREDENGSSIIARTEYR